MLSSNNLLDRLSEWHEKILDQYGHANAQGNIGAAVSTARAGIAAIESFSHLTERSEVAQALADIQRELEEVRERLDREQEEG